MCEGISSFKARWSETNQRWTKKSEIKSEGWNNYLMEAEVVLDGVRAEEDDSLGGHHQHEAVEGLQTENKKFI